MCMTVLSVCMFDCFVCLSVCMYAYIYVHCMHAQYPLRSEEGTRAPRFVVKDHYKIPCGCWELHLCFHIKHEGWMTFSSINKLQKAGGTPTTPSTSWEGRKGRKAGRRKGGGKPGERAVKLLLICLHKLEAFPKGKNSESIPQALNTNMQINQKRDLLFTFSHC